MKRANRTLPIGFVTLVCFSFLSALVRADTIYVSNLGFRLDPGHIDEFDSSGNGSAIASFSLGNCPGGLAFDSSGNLYGVVCGGIDKFDSSGNATPFATGLSDPTGLAFDNSGNLYVGETGSDVVEEFDPNGNRTVFAHVYDPEGLAFDSSGNLYVSTFGHIIYKFDSSRNQSTFANVGYSDRPVGLAFDSSGYLYSANEIGGTIDKFDTSGNMTIFASNVTGAAGLAFDSDGALYLTQTLGGHTITKFDSSGNGTFFANDGFNPAYIAIQTVPEPATSALVALGVSAIFASRRFCRRPS
jgi:secreted PhoX family phosphatase